jgi:hypothetical protein
MISFKAAYRLLCEQQSLPLQMQPWWLDAVCGEDNWNVALSFDGGGKINGALPYFLTRKIGLTVIQMPPFTTYAGPWMQLPDDPTMKLPRVYTLQKQILGDLAVQLPKVAFYSQNFYPDCTNWLPFYWKGFRQTTRYTYVLENLADLDAIYDHFKRTVRTDLKKAETQVEVFTGDNVALFYELNAKSYQRQGRRIPYPAAKLFALDKALYSRERRQIYFAKDRQSGAVHAALYVAWDGRAAYSLLSGADADFKNSAAPHLLFWQAVQDAARKVHQFDFEGSMLEPVEHVLRSFGAVQKPYFRIFKFGNRLLETAAILSGRF